MVELVKKIINYGDSIINFSFLSRGLFANSILVIPLLNSSVGSKIARVEDTNSVGFVKTCDYP